MLAPPVAQTENGDTLIAQYCTQNAFQVSPSYRWHLCNRLFTLLSLRESKSSLAQVPAIPQCHQPELHQVWI